LRTTIADAALPTEARLHVALARGEAPALATDLRVQLAAMRAELQRAPTLPVPAAASPPAAPGPALTPPPTPLAPAVESAIARAATPARGPERAAASTAAPAPEPRAPAGAAAADAAAADPTSPALTTTSSKQLAEQVEAVILRLTSNHLQNAATAAQPASAFAVDVPLVHPHGAALLHFAYEREARHSGTDDAPGAARVVVNLSFDDGGDFTAWVRLHGDELGIRLGASDAALHAALGARLGELARALEARALTVRELVLAHLTPDERPRTGGRALIDARV
jgi:hypothetical protein